jgi:hypothetical protein
MHSNYTEHTSATAPDAIHAVAEPYVVPTTGSGANAATTITTTTYTVPPPSGTAAMPATVVLSNLGRYVCSCVCVRL